MKRLAWILGAATAVMACSGGDGGSLPDNKGDFVPTLPNKADHTGAGTVVESGRFRASGTWSGRLQGSEMQAFRFNAFGNTRVQIALHATSGKRIPLRWEISFHASGLNRALPFITPENIIYSMD